MIPANINALLLGEEAGAGAGYQVSRSLRFNSADSSYLSRTPASAGNRKTWTFSCWAKLSYGATDYFLRNVNSGNNDSGYILFSLSSLGDIRLSGWATNWLQTTAVYRDPSAWYHIVLAVDTTQATASNRLKLYVNGSQVTQLAVANYPSQNLVLPINAAAEHDIGVTADFYLADVHLVDGQALDPTSFGEFSATTGVWMPKAYTGTYGTNGFHLDFSNNASAAALGTDTSGNGNTWNVNNMSAAAGVNYANTSTTSASSGTIPNGGTPYWIDILPTNASLDYNGTGFSVHDSSLANYVYWVGDEYSSGNVTRARFDLRDFPSIANVQLYIQSYSGYVDYRARLLDASKTVIAGTDIALTSYTLNWISIPVSGAPRYLEIYCSSGGSRRLLLYAVRVNGITLISGGAGDIDSLVDVPTNGSEVDTGSGGQVRGNYCTWNPLIGSDQFFNYLARSCTFSNGNLDFVANSASNFSSCLSTVGVASGKWYAELSVTVFAGSTSCGFGFINSSQIKDITSGTSLGSAADGYLRVGVAVYNGAGRGSSGYSAIALNDVIMLALDVGAGKAWFGRNGTWDTGSPAVGTTPTVSFTPNGSYLIGAAGYESSAGTLNAGARPFAYTAPSGFKALCTANLPAPVVTKPSTVMDVKLYTGNGSTQTISGLGFSPDLVWGKQRNGTASHVWMDVIRGTGVYLRSDLTNAESANANVITSFDSNGFTLGTSSALNGSTNSYAAWCWDAGSSTVTNTQGSITSQVRANASAGFSICTFTFNSTGTVGHGLGVAPEFIIVKTRGTSAQWLVYHKSLGTSKYIRLSFTGEAVTFADAWNPVNSTVFQMEAGLHTLSTYVAYCWAPVAGYSAFGSYTGNGSSDGPFVYTGFRPRWVMWKSSSTGGSVNYDWIIQDSARMDRNVIQTTRLSANTANSESSDVYVPIDFLSNGFKMRGTGAEGNANTQTYVWAAFAESPFAYSRAR